MSYNALNADKDFEKEEEQQQTQITLPNIVTMCLAPCNVCTGTYVDTTLSYKLRCGCPCHQCIEEKNSFSKSSGGRKVSSQSEPPQPRTLNAEGTNGGTRIDSKL